MSSRVHVLAWSALHAAFWMHAAFVDWLRWLRWRAMSILPARKQLIAQPPAHLGIVFAKEEICIERIADLVAWCAEAGIGCITLCDWDGTLLAAENELSLALSTRSIAHSSQAVGGTADAVGVSLRVVTLQTGRDDLVEAARYFCEQVHTQRLAVGAIDEAAIDRYLDTANKSPELALVLQFCHPALLGGVLPWKCRLAQYEHMGHLRHCSRAMLQQALVEFAKVRQRHGA